MDEIYLDKCKCGGDAEFLMENNNTRIFAQCKICGIRTPSKAASIEYSAKKLVADIWNAEPISVPAPIEQGGAS